MQWADYSADRIAASALKAAGFGGVLRYVGYGRASKRLTAPEYTNLVQGGIQVALVVESSTSDAWGSDTDDDFARGVQFGQAGLNDARALGVPDSVPIACAADAHATSAQLDDVVRFASGFASVVGKARAGFYGFQETLNAVRAADVVSWYWRCGSQPSTAEQAWTHLWQRNDRKVTVGGIQVDINEQYLPLPIVGGGGASPTSSTSASTPAGLAALYEEDGYMPVDVKKGGAKDAPAKKVLAVSMLREHDLIIAPGDMPVVLYGSYHWDWTEPGTGGNPVADPKNPKIIGAHESFSYIVPKGTGKVDIRFWSDDDFSVTIAPR